MHIKYIVYCKENQSIPCVDIWTTRGDLTHPIYAQNHHIRPQNISSEGYLNFNPSTQSWILEHYQIDDGVPPRTFKEFFAQKKLEKRDKLLVRKKIHQTPFLKNPRLRLASYLTMLKLKKEKWKIFKKLLCFQHD